jgi:hypothetical protein
MEAQAKLCFLRLLDLQIELAALVERLCQETMMSPEMRKKLSNDASNLRERLQKTHTVIQR